MAWNLPAQGVYAGDQNINFDRPRHTGFVPQEQQTSDAVQQAIATIAGILRQRQQDKIANQLLAVDNAPKATAVSGQAPDPAKYQPDAQLTQAMMQTNLGMGLPTTDSGVVPNRGGWEGLQTADLIRKRLEDRQDSDLHRRFVQSEITRNERAPREPGLTPDFQYKVQHGLLKGQETGEEKTADEDYNSALKQYQDRISKYGAGVGAYGLSPEEAGGIDITTPNAVKYTTIDPDTGKAVNVSTEQANKFLADKDTAGSVFAEGDVSGKHFRVPLKEFQSLMSERGSLPQRPVRPATRSYSGDGGSAAIPTSKMERARQALSDPEATPEEKARAKEILAGL